jgi:hypothetical protein
MDRSLQKGFVKNFSKQHKKIQILDKFKKINEVQNNK